MDVVKELNYKTSELASISDENFDTDLPSEKILAILTNSTARKANFSLLSTPRELDAKTKSLDANEILWNTYSSIIVSTTSKVKF